MDTFSALQLVAFLSGMMLISSMFVGIQWPRIFKWYLSVAFCGFMATGIIGIMEYPENQFFPALLIVGIIMLVLFWWLWARLRQEGV